MLKLLAFGAGFGAGFQAWRNFPPDGPTSADMVAVVFALGLVGAFLGGLWLSRARGSSSTATATATAAAVAGAQSSSAVNIFMGAAAGGGAHSSGVALPTDQAPWLLGVQERPQLSVDDFDGMDLAEFVEGGETEHA